MAVRPIDANELYRIEKLLDTDIVRQDKVALNLLEQVLYDIQHVPTLTPSNEWVSVEERLPRLRENVLVCAYWHEHWGVYIGWNNGHGWTVSCGIGQRNDVQVSHWMLLPAPPDRRLPEGEEDS